MIFLVDRVAVARATDFIVSVDWKMVSFWRRGTKVCRGDGTCGREGRDFRHEDNVSAAKGVVFVLWICGPAFACVHGTVGCGPVARTQDGRVFHEEE